MGRTLVGAINRPRAWSSFSFKVVELNLLLEKLDQWKVVCEHHIANREAHLIVQNVISQNRMQSYVALNHPSGHSYLFDNERSSSVLASSLF